MVDVGRERGYTKPGRPQLPLINERHVDATCHLLETLQHGLGLGGEPAVDQEERQTGGRLILVVVLYFFGAIVPRVIFGVFEIGNPVRDTA